MKAGGRGRGIVRTDGLGPTELKRGKDETRRLGVGRDARRVGGDAR